ncbi:MAG TPA: hypothetical protein VFA66_10165 [Gaiellaceae bacterium]|nr:hypothetical protein [Gaiellaceae bacterium]
MPVSREGGYACRRCGKVYRKRRSLTHLGYCRTGCGIIVMLEHNIGLGDPSSPQFRAWAERIHEMAERRAGAPPPEQDHPAEL